MPLTPATSTMSSRLSNAPSSMATVVAFCVNRRRAPYRISAAGFSSPLPEPDMRLSLRIRLSGRHGEVRRPHPCEAEPFDASPVEQVLLDYTLAPKPSRRAAATGLMSPQNVAYPCFGELLPHPSP